MGYTHYFQVDGKMSEKNWSDFKVNVELLVNNLPKFSKSSGGYYSNVPLEIDYELTDDSIYINGVGEFEHESLIISNDYINDFCKTNAKPYDVVVQTVLLLLKHFNNNCTIKSDGKIKDWKQAIQLYNKIIKKHLLKNIY